MSARRDQLHTSIAVLASALLHASVVGVAGLTSTTLLSSSPDALRAIPAAAPLPPIIEPPKPPSNSDTIPVGNPDSLVEAEAWIGYDEFQEHIGVNRAPVDQPELTLDPPAAPDDAAPSPISSPPTPPPSPAQAASAASAPTSAPADQVEQPEPPLDTPASSAEPLPPQTSPLADRITLDAPQEQSPAPPLDAPVEEPDRPFSGDEPLPPIDTSPPPPSEPAELEGPPSEPGETTPPLADISPPAPEPSVEQPASVPIPHAPPPSPSATDDSSGEQTDRESDLAAIKTAARAHLGKPLATKGLRIRTIKPRASHYNSILARYIDPVVRVHFNKRGIVEKVEFIRRSENRDVDLYVLNAIYQWTAEGPQLDELPDKDPPATLSVEFIIVRPLSG